jgi:hypothetical protein
MRSLKKLKNKKKNNDRRKKTMKRRGRNLCSRHPTKSLKGTAVAGAPIISIKILWPNRISRRKKLFKMKRMMIQ